MFVAQPIYRCNVMNRYLSSLHPAVIISDNVLVLHHGGVREHLVHRHLLVVAVVAQRFLADLDGVHDAVKTVAGFLHHAKLAGGDLAQLQKFQFVSKKEKSSITNENQDFCPVLGSKPINNCRIRTCFQP